VKRTPAISLLAALLLTAGCGDAGSPSRAAEEPGLPSSAAEPDAATTTTLGATPPSAPVDATAPTAAPIPPQRGTIIEARLVRETAREELQALADEIQLPGVTHVRHGLDWWRIEYWTIDPFGEPTPASGTVIVPDGLTGPAPVISDQHGTQTLRMPPSDDPMAQEVFAAGLLFGTRGAIVVGADYLGFGSSELVHPYYHAASEGSAATDMLVAARSAAADMGVQWSGQLFLTGYSQGAHVTMAMHRELEARPELGFEVTASVAMAGAYDLVDISVPLSLATPSASTPLYLAYAMYGLHSAGAITSELDQIFAEGWQEQVPRLFDGTVAAEQIAAVLPTDPQALFTQDVLDQLTSGQGPIADVLRANSVMDWTPRAPIRIIHGTDDRDVPVENARAIVERMTSRGADVELVLLDGLDHATASMPAYLDAAAWITALIDTSAP